MWLDYIKTIKKMAKKDQLKFFEILEKIEKLNLDWLDVKKMKWYDNLFRIRCWKIRIIFKKELWKWITIEINSRWDVYKKF